MITGIKYTETPSPLRTCYTFEGLTPRGERLQVELSAHINDGSRHDLANLWYKHGYTAAPLPSYWCVDVYAYDAAGCWGRYNPTVFDHSNKLNFDWVLPATPANRHKILAEIIRRANKEA
jgi:hypothetical protein